MTEWSEQGAAGRVKQRARSYKRVPVGTDFPVVARFDAGHLSFDGGPLILREVEQRLDVAGRLAACIADPRNPDDVVHGIDEIIRFAC